jgi:hypothetical protein
LRAGSGTSYRRVKRGERPAIRAQAPPPAVPQAEGA